jgi:hypothetical protein
MENSNTKQIEKNPATNSNPRRVVALNIAGVENTMYTQCEYVIAAACDDGSIWLIRNRDSEWFELPPIPQASSNKK